MKEECLDRLENPAMEYYKHVYQNSDRWTPDKGSLEGKKVIVYGEQGYGDIIQFARYLPVLKERGCEVFYQCPKPLHRVFESLEVGLLDKDCPDIPEHDFNILSMSLPFVLDQQRTFNFPYLKVEEKADLGDEPDVKKIGVCWEGNPNHSENASRNCPLEHFKMLECPFTKLVMLQKQIYDPNLLDRCDDIDLYGHEIDDFYDTATVINSLDMVVTVDTAVLHLAGALGKLTYGLLNLEHDPRWDIETWYPSVVLVKLKEQNNWPAAFRTVIHMCTGLVTEKDPDKDLVDDILNVSHV
jgi:hypothetical protein